MCRIQNRNSCASFAIGFLRIPCIGSALYVVLVRLICAMRFVRCVPQMGTGGTVTQPQPPMSPGGPALQQQHTLTLQSSIFLSKKLRESNPCTCRVPENLGDNRHRAISGLQRTLCLQSLPKVTYNERKYAFRGTFRGKER